MSGVIDQVYPNPNTVYDDTHTVVSVFNITTDTNQFCNTYNHNNKYGGLQLGQVIVINDGIYNKRWYIAGFDMEYNQLAADGTTYDNGYGICLIPESYLVDSQWNTTNTVTGGYLNSYINKNTLLTISNNLKKVLGNHLINRNVLLSSSVNSEYKSNNYTWTKAYCTLMSIYQISGYTTINNTIYDDGEANYKLPLFDHMNRTINSHSYWTRGIWGLNGLNYSPNNVQENSMIFSLCSNLNSGVRPMIYIR